MKIRSKCFILLFLFTILLSVFSQSQPQDSIDHYYQGGIKAYEQKDYKNYLRNFQILDSLRNNHPVIMYRLSGAYSLNRMKNEAIRYLKKWILIDADPRITEDEDFAFVRESKEFKAILNAIERIRTPVSRSQTAFIIKEKDLHPESIAYDEITGIFYFGSIHQRKIVCIDKNQCYRNFTESGKDQLWAVSGMKIESGNRRLWVCSMAIPQMINFHKEEKGFTGIFQYDLDTGRLVKKYLIRDKSQSHTFGDLAIHPTGDVYITDSGYPAIYLILKESDTLEPFMVLNGFRSIQGLDFSEDGKHLFFADYIKGIHLIDLETRTLIGRLNHTDDVSCKGIDGLYYYQSILIAIQNGINPMRVSRFFLSDDLKKITSHSILESNNPVFNEPTLGVIVDDFFYYIANSQWSHYEKDGSIYPLEKLDDIHVYKILLSN